MVASSVSLSETLSKLHTPGHQDGPHSCVPVLVTGSLTYWHMECFLRRWRRRSREDGAAQWQADGASPQPLG